jgi:hypothetical protein
LASDFHVCIFVLLHRGCGEEESSGIETNAEERGQSSHCQQCR